MNTESPQLPSASQLYPYVDKFEELKLDNEHDSEMKDVYSDESSEEEEDSGGKFDLERHLVHVRSEKIVKEFLRQVEENRVAEFPWPPGPDCPQYRYGFINQYEGEVEFEEESETAKRFLDQVRKSWGYDVDCIPPKWMDSRLCPIDLQLLTHRVLFKIPVKKARKGVIDRINTHAKKMGKSFELVRVNKAVAAGRCLFLFTFTIKDVETSAEITFVDSSTISRSRS